jgi:hypothetical protein
MWRFSPKGSGDGVNRREFPTTTEIAEVLRNDVVHLGGCVRGNIGSTFDSHARDPGFESWAGQAKKEICLCLIHIYGGWLGTPTGLSPENGASDSTLNGGPVWQSWCWT